MPKRKGRPLKQRRVDYKELRPRLLIVCEGEKTEPNYFRRFKVSTYIVEVMGLGENTLGVVKRAIEEKEAGEYSEVWKKVNRVQGYLLTDPQYAIRFKHV